MLQISLFSLWQHKKSVFFLMIVYALLLSLVLTVFPLIQIVKTTIFDGLSQKYGIFHAMLFDMQQSKEGILQDASIASYGKIILYDSWDISGSASPITLGHFDETAISLGKIRPLQGAFPLNPDEIALEQNALYQFSDSPEIGDTISLSNANNERLDLKLVGILADYSTHWRIADTGYEAGRTDFPKGIIAESTTLPSSAMHTLLFFADVPLIQNDGGQIESFQFMSKYNITEYAVNDNLYNLAYSEYLGPFDFFMVLFLIVIALSIVLVSYKAHATYLTHYESMYQKLFFLGAEDEFPFLMYGLHSLVILFLSIFCGFALSILLSFLIKVVFSVSILSQIFSSTSMVMLSISLVVFIVIQLFTYLQRIKKMRGISLSTLKADKDPINQIKIKNNVSAFLFQSSLKRNFPKLVMLLSLICVLCVFFAVSQLYFSNLTAAQYQANPAMYNDFFLDSQKLRRFKTYDSYFPFHFSKDIYFPLSIREELSRLEGIQFVTYYGTSQNPCGMTLTINDANNTYWKEWCVPDMRNLEVSLIDTPSIMGMFDFNVFILDVDSLSAFQSQYPSTPTELYTTNSAILFAPDVTRYTGETSTEEATIISEEYFSSKNALSFIVLESSVPPNEAIKNPEALITAKTYALPLAQVMHQPFVLEYNGQEIKYDRPTIVLTLSTAENTDLFPGIETFSATLKKDISEAQYLKIEETMQKIIASNPYSDIFILRDQLEQDQLFMNTINRAFFITFSIVGGLVLTSFLSILSLSLQQRSHSYAIMRALGMKKRQIFISILLELLIYVGFCVVVIGILGILSGIFTLKKVLATVPSLLMLSPIFIAIFLVSLFIFLFSTIIAWQFTRKIYQSSVYSVMRESLV